RTKPGSLTLFKNATRGVGSGGPHCACTFADTAIPTRTTRTRRRFIAYLQSFRKGRIIAALRLPAPAQASARRGTGRPAGRPLAHALQQLLHPSHRPVEEVGPEGVEVADRAAIAGAVAEEFIELVEVDRAALQIAVRARLLEHLHQLVARDRRVLADVLQHPL